MTCVYSPLEAFMRAVALCGSLRKGSYNQAILDAAIPLAATHGLEIVQAPIGDFPLFNQDLENDPPAPVVAAKQLIESGDCLWLVSPEHNYGVPGVLKNAIDWLSRPARTPTLYHRPMAVAGVSTGRMGTIRAQLAWRQIWYFFDAPVFSAVEFGLPNARSVIDAQGQITDPEVEKWLDSYLAALAEWIPRCQAPG